VTGMRRLKSGWVWGSFMYSRAGSSRRIMKQLGLEERNKELRQW
jgi:hypothetical protein